MREARSESEPAADGDLRPPCLCEGVGLNGLPVHSLARGESIAVLFEIMSNPRVSPAARVSAAGLVLTRGWGQPYSGGDRLRDFTSRSDAAAAEFYGPRDLEPGEA